MIYTPAEALIALLDLSDAMDRVRQIDTYAVADHNNQVMVEVLDALDGEVDLLAQAIVDHMKQDQ